MNEEKKNLRLATAISAFVVIFCASSGAYLLTPSSSNVTCALLLAGWSTCAVVIAQLIWKTQPFTEYAPTRLLCDCFLGVGIVGALICLDALVGFIVNSNQSFFEAARSHVGFAVTVFLSPIALVPVVTALKVLAFKILMKVFDGHGQR